MQSSISTRVLFALTFLASATLADTATAQLGPGGYYGGGWGYNAGVSAYNTRANVAARQRAQSESRAMKQNLVMQQDIRGTLETQARGRIQGDLSRQQSTKDWWFQHQQQSARRAVQPRSLAGPASVGAAPPSFAASTLKSTAAEQSTDIIKWPRILRNQRFAKQRARVEAPYLDRTPAAGRPTADDYREMIDAAAQMKTILKGLAYEISAGEFLEVEKFLDTLAAEAREGAKRKATVRTD